MELSLIRVEVVQRVTQPSAVFQDAATKVEVFACTAPAYVCPHDERTGWKNGYYGMVVMGPVALFPDHHPVFDYASCAIAQMLNIPEGGELDIGYQVPKEGIVHDGIVAFHCTAIVPFWPDPYHAPEQHDLENVVITTARQ